MKSALGRKPFLDVSTQRIKRLPDYSRTSFTNPKLRKNSQLTESDIALRSLHVKSSSKSIHSAAGLILTYGYAVGEHGKNRCSASRNGHVI